MEKELWDSLRKGTQNRIYVWQEMFKKAHIYLNIECTIDLSNIQMDLECFTIEPKPMRLATKVYIRTALLESAVIFFSNVFTTGGECDGIADNKDPEVESIRNKMKEHAFNKLGGSREEYDKFINKVRANRNKLIAHYDASAADYQEINSCITCMKLPTVDLSCDEIRKLEMIIRYMSEFLYWHC